MTKASQPKVTLATPVILYGFDEQNRPRAARFPERVCDLAIKAAKQLKLNVLPVTSPQAIAVASKLPEGRISKSGRGLVAHVLPEICRILTEIAEETNPATAPGLPRSWDDIAVGHLVVAFENKDDGWWEAIVIEKTDDMLTLRWRDYPKQPTLIRHRDAVALLKPSIP